MRYLSYFIVVLIEKKNKQLSWQLKINLKHFACFTVLHLFSCLVTFIDLQKAFDFVNRDLLQNKLQLIGINGTIYI